MEEYNACYDTLSNLQTLSQVAVDVLSDSSSQDSQATEFMLISGTSHSSQSSVGSSSLSWSEQETDRSSQAGKSAIGVESEAEFATLASTLLKLKSRPESTSGQALVSHNHEEDLFPKISCKRAKLRHEKMMSQGRPFSKSIKVRLIMHKSTQEALFFLNSSKAFKYKGSGGILGAPRNVKNKSQPIVRDFCYNSSLLDKNMFEVICEQFGISSFNFLKVTRDGPLKSIEVSVLSEDLNKVTPKWVKLKVCFPRYKANMKIHLVSSNISNSHRAPESPVRSLVVTRSEYDTEAYV